MAVSSRPGSKALDLVFGPGDINDSAEERAAKSHQVFVRSQDHLALDRPEAKGLRLSAWQALQAFGFDLLHEAADAGVAPIPTDASEPARSLSERRIALGLSEESVAKAAGVSPEAVRDAENPKTRTSIRILEQIAQSLALDDLRLSVARVNASGSELAVRLRQLGALGQEFSPSFVTQINEAAWVMMKEQELSTWLGRSCDTRSSLGFSPSSNYGDRDYPAWQHGYWLASRARDMLGIGPEAPIENLRQLIGDVLRVPVVQLSLGATCAGATISAGNVRGIAVNIKGLNGNVWVRRATLAHELGHLLWDPDERLERLRVDSYGDFEKNPYLAKDYVEARANAFAIEFLAPQKSALAEFNKHGSGEHGLRAVMERFGVSFTSARFQIWNALDRKVPIDELKVGSTEPTDDWKGRESFTLDLFHPDSVPDSRRGQFASLVVQALDKRLITDDSAASLLRCGASELNRALSFLRSAFELAAPASPPLVD